MIFNKKLSLGLILSVALSTTGCSIPNLSNSSDPASSTGNNKQVQKSFSSKAVMNQLSEGYNETAYLLAYPDVAAAVADGRLPDGYTHYKFVGRSENRLTNPAYIDAKNAVVYEGFSARAYLNAFSDVSAAYGVNNSKAAYQHYITYGRIENRLDNPTYINETLKSGFNEEAYLLAYPEVKSAVRMGQYLNGYEHFIIMGRSQGLLSTPAYIAIRNDIANNGYNDAAYILAFPDVAAAVNAGTLSSGYQHYTTQGKNENRLGSPVYQAIRQAYVFEYFVEEAYILAFPDVAAAVKSGSISSGYTHYRNSGKAEGRLDRLVYDTAYINIIDGYDEEVYLLAFPDVAAAVNAGTFKNGYAHYIALGKNEKRLDRQGYRTILAGTQFVPIKPMNLTATNKTTTSFTINWEKSLGATAYNVYNGNTLLATVKADSATSNNISGLSPNTTYNISVTAKNVRGESAKSTLSVTTVIAAPTTGPTNVTATNITQTTATLNFTAVNGATSYNIYQGATLVATQAGTSYNITNLTAGTTYTYSVSAVNSSGESAKTSVTFTASPGSPTGLTVTAITNSSLTLNFNATPGAVKYKVFIYQTGTTENLTPVAELGATTTSYQFSPLMQNTNYTLKVLSSDGTTDSGKSSITATTSSINFGGGIGRN